MPDERLQQDMPFPVIAAPAGNSASMERLTPAENKVRLGWSGRSQHSLRNPAQG